jgi:hypothetical protein
VRRPLAAAAVLLATLAIRAAAVAPPVVPWTAASAHLGEIVTVEGDVATARVAGDTCVLEFSADDPRAFRAVLVVPILSSLPRHPERLYEGKRVRVSGRVQRFAGRPEMVLHSPSQIEVVDLGTPPAVAAAPTPKAPPAPPPVAAAPRPAPAAAPTRAAPPEPEPAEEPPARGLAEAVGQKLAQIDPCERARARWRDAAADAGERTASLSRCLAAGGYHCRAEAAALAPALTSLEWSEQQVDDTCR